MSEQSEREAYNEAAREDHEGREREAMDRPMFTQRDMDAAVQGEREACAMALSAKSDDMHRLRATKDNRGQESAILLGGAIAYADAAEIIRSRGTSPAVDVMGVVREYVEADDAFQRGMGGFDSDAERKAAGDRWLMAFYALRSLVAASPKAKKPAHKGESDEQS